MLIGFSFERMEQSSPSPSLGNFAAAAVVSPNKGGSTSLQRHLQRYRAETAAAAAPKAKATIGVSGGVKQQLQQPKQQQQQ